MEGEDMLKQKIISLWKVLLLIFLLSLSGFISGPAYAANASSTNILVQCSSSGVVTNNTAITGVDLPITYDTSGNFYVNSVDVAIFTGVTLVKELEGFTSTNLHIGLGAVTNYNYNATTPIVYEIKYRGHYGVIGEGAQEITEDWQDSGLYFTVTQTSPAVHDGGDGGGGGTLTTQPVNSTTGSATVKASDGGTVRLGGEATVQIPAGALKGASGVKVTVQKDETPPEAPSGFMVQGNVYQFTVGGQDHYTFNSPVTLTFTFDPAALAPGEEPTVFYYDEVAGQWVNIGGTLSGDTITVTVDHFSSYAVMVNNSGVKRLSGLSRVDTSLAIAKATYKDKVQNVLLATADNYPDALAGSVLAYKLNAPILLVGRSGADQAKVLDYLKSNLDQAGNVYILGGTAIVSSATEGKIAASGFTNITRLGGTDRYDTSIKIADQLKVKTGTPIILAYGESYPDALSISSIAAEMQYPILLVQKDGIKDVVKKEIAAIKPTKVYIIGGEGVISATVENQVAQITAIDKANIVRIAGEDRYQTSLAVAQYFNLNEQNICVATGKNFPDALAGSVYAANHNAPIILADGKLSEQVINYLKDEKITKATLFGGEASVSKNIEQQLTQLIGQ